MVAFGAELFVNETFAGNGRTCATCHPASNNFTLDPLFIATLPASDPLFVAEQVPALATLEVPTLMRERALIVENVDGFDRPGVLRSVPHTLAMSESLSPPTCVDPTCPPGNGGGNGNGNGPPAPSPTPTPTPVVPPPQ